MNYLCKSFSAAFLFALLLTPAAWADNKENDPDQIGNRDVGKGVNFYSIEKEIALGKQLAQEVERQAKIINDPVVAEYVNRLGQNLARNSDAKVPFTIKVIDSNQVNAFALPGGFMFVNSGLILKASNEAELAGVMAHEIGHVAARHGTKEATRAALINYATIPLIFMGGGWAGYGIEEAASAAVPIAFLKYSRSMEAEADLLGLEYMYKAGYDPECFVDFFEKIETLERTKPSAVSRLFSTHPMTDDRIKAAQKHIQQLLKAQPEYVMDTSEFEDVKARLAMLENVHRLNKRDDKRPTLIRRGSGKIDDNASQQSDDSDDERPTLKRRD
jgi:beta-barrel assembly-enhancing protease